MKILVTGGSGFIGGRLAEKFLVDGHDVILGSRTARDAQSFFGKFLVQQVNWNCDRSLADACAGVGTVIHAAGMDAAECAANPVEALGFNGLATARLIAAAVHAKVKNFLYLSTAHVYSGNLVGKINENTPPKNLHPYATSHLVGENFLLYQSQLSNINGVVVRLSNAFGIPAFDNQKCWNLLINNLCMQATKNQEIRLRTNGTQQRNFISAEQVCKSISRILRGSHNNENKIINLGCVDYTILEISKIIQQRCAELFNFTPIIHLTNEPIYGCNEKLKYESNVLLGYGVQIENDIEYQVDILLKECMSFSNKDKNFGPYLFEGVKI